LKEPSIIPNIHWHETDLLIATGKHSKMLILSFAGMASAADAVTNLQTFEPTNHSQIFRYTTQTTTSTPTAAATTTADPNQQ